MKSSFHRLISFFLFLLNHLGLPSSELDPVPFWLQFVTLCYSASIIVYSVRSSDRALFNSSARTPRKTPSSTVKNACLLDRYLAMLIHVTISSQVINQSCSRVLQKLQKLLPSINSLPFMEPEGPLIYQQEFATRVSPEWDESNSAIHTPIL
jgi:hypothetical protein